MISLSWCEHHLILPLGVWLSVGAVFICSKTSIASMRRWNRKSENVAHPLKANEMFAILNLSLCTNAHKPFLVLIWVWLNWCECLTTNLLPQTLSGFLVEVDDFYTRVDSPSCIFHMIVPDLIRKKSTGIPGGANPRFTLCEDETTTRGCGSSAL